VTRGAWAVIVAACAHTPQVHDDASVRPTALGVIQGVIGFDYAEVFDAINERAAFLPIVAVAVAGGQRRVTCTDERGFYKLSELPPGHYTLELGAAASVDDQRYGADVIANRVTPLHLRLTRPFEPAGEALDACAAPAVLDRLIVDVVRDGTPVRAAQIALEPRGRATAAPVSVQSRSVERGRGYELGPVPRGQYEAVVRIDGAAYRYPVTLIGGPLRRIRIALPPCGMSVGGSCGI